MSLTILKKISLAQFIVFSGISLRIIQLLKETYYLNVFENSEDLSLYISLKANMDIFLIFTSSIFFYESCYKDGKISVPIFPILISILAALYFVNNNFIIENNFAVFLLVLFGSFISIFTNLVVILAKESGELATNLFANGFENYILIVVILIFIAFSLPQSFVLYTTVLILSQIIISSIIFFRLQKNDFAIKANFRIKDSILSLPRILGSTVILIAALITRVLFETNTEIILLNYSLIISTAPLLLIERYFEYSKKGRMNSIRPLYLVIILILIQIAALSLLIILHRLEMIYEIELAKGMLILLRSIEYFLMLFPLFLYFILFKKESNFNRNAIIILFASYLLSMIFSVELRSDIFLFGLCLASSFFLIKSYEFKNSF